MPLPVPQVPRSLLSVKPSARGPCLGRCLLVRNLEDWRQEEILTKLTTFKKINVYSLSVILAATLKCSATRLALHLVPGGVGGLGCAGRMVPRL